MSTYVPSKATCKNGANDKQCSSSRSQALTPSLKPKIISKATQPAKIPADGTDADQKHMDVLKHLVNVQPYHTDKDIWMT